MYFNDKKSNTNIDSEFKEKTDILSLILSIIKKYRILLFISLVLALIILMILMFVNKELVNYLTLTGEETITLYQGSDYIEPGYQAYNSKDEDLTSKVVINSNLNTKEVGEYEISYTIGSITKVRNINIIAKPQEYTYIYLKTVNNSVNVYIKINDKYTEPGYQAFSSTGTNLTNKVSITGEVDTSKKGIYKLIYSVIDSNNVTVSVSRTVIIMDSEISLTLQDDKYTNKEVTINALVIDEYFDYMLLPDNTKITTSTYSYKVSENGKYTFKVYNQKGNIKEATIEVKNIDKVAPSGSCTIDQYENYSIININATDNIGIKKYVYNNKEYVTTTINVSELLNNAKITIYDNANNIKDINCTVLPKVHISSIKQDGVIITVNAKKVNNDITGYYFSYNNKRPNKNTGGYISTSKENIDVVRLPGTTYVWVEDKSGKISSYKTVTITNDALLNTNGNDYKILENTTLETYLKNQGWSIEELDKLMARSVRAAGLYTKEASATASVALLAVLAQKYKIKLPYWWGGKSWSIGADPTWGKYKVVSSEDNTYYYYGLDCSGFTTWAYVNAGYDVRNSDSIYPAYFWNWQQKSLNFTKENGEVGDFITSSGHVKLIIGKTSTAFITAEAKGKNYGMVISTHNYNKPNGYKIQKGELLMDTYGKISSSNYPTGF